MSSSFIKISLNNHNGILWFIERITSAQISDVFSLSPLPQLEDAAVHTPGQKFDTRLTQVSRSSEGCEV